MCCLCSALIMTRKWKCINFSTKLRVKNMCLWSRWVIKEWSRKVVWIVFRIIYHLFSVMENQWHTQPTLQFLYVRVGLISISLCFTSVTLSSIQGSAFILRSYIFNCVWILWAPVRKSIIQNSINSHFIEVALCIYGSFPKACLIKNAKWQKYVLMRNSGHKIYLQVTAPI